METLTYIRTFITHYTYRPLLLFHIIILCTQTHVLKSMYVHTYLCTNTKLWVSKWAALCTYHWGQQECTPAPQLTGAIGDHHCGGGTWSSKRIRCLLVERRLGLWWCHGVHPSRSRAHIPMCVNICVCVSEY